MAGQLGKKATIGRLRQYVTIQVPTVTTDAFGGKLTTWTDVDSVKAEVVPTGGREIFQSGATQSQFTHRVRMRYRQDVTAQNRLLWVDTGLILNVVACPPSVGTDNLTELWCVIPGG